MGVTECQGNLRKISMIRIWSNKLGIILNVSIFFWSSRTMHMAMWHTGRGHSGQTTGGTGLEGVRGSGQERHQHEACGTT